MSQLAELKIQVLQVAKAAAEMVDQLDRISKGIDKQISDVHQTIEDAAPGTDKQMILSYGQAKEAINNASLAMQVAAEKAIEWANNA